jgi:hypothetical protein
MKPLKYKNHGPECNFGYSYVYHLYSIQINKLIRYWKYTPRPFNLISAAYFALEMESGIYPKQLMIGLRVLLIPSLSILNK